MAVRAATVPGVPPVKGPIVSRIDPRLRAIWELSVPEIREYAGVHDYDGEVLDLSPAGVRSGLGRLHGGEGQSREAGPRRTGRPARDGTAAHDEAHLLAAEAGLRTRFEIAESHRWNPLLHIGNLDVSCYDREYAPAEQRAAARRAHLARWPEAVDASLESLDRVPAPVATALLPAARGLAVGVEDEQALAAQSRFVARLEQAAADGPPEVALGAEALARLLGDPEAMPLDLGKMESTADRERDRLSARLLEDCGRLSPGTPLPELMARLDSDHPDPEGLYAAASEAVEEVSRFTVAHDLLPDPGGRLLVGPAPASRRYATAMMSPGGPYEEEAPGWFHVNPPDPSFDPEETEQWLAVFSATTLPVVAAHETTPGHFAQQRLLCRLARSDVRRSLASEAFVEGWAHYAEELLVEAGYRQDDPRYAIGVWKEALLRVTRLACALGVHAGSMTVAEATRRFEQDAFLAGPAARSEAGRATFDPTYGRYTWGKLEILALRDEAIARRGRRFSLRSFHEALLSLGAPPLATIGDALEGGDS